ncbi:uncharacterized protein BO96DRAFT_396925 [Aspergillus niger CBS 101883]|uniref:Uncharacterized protein n=2 Tax=Aspergillus niger TaxID=5061 RepID=A2R9L3_ASPNC|nr:uncharacterized protein BO96DRAFT_396925 [Aspergillus niger CBS 101883]XP_059605868.1 hypothetical protein An17g01835 [Aspergillus niger]PYH54956.1 hypothetical protein BO96DRAFT_396925 [Aspergillus niger CBS 101883]CAK49140.1 hypothetical protein An17g01835 [Aspergillus niger]
MKQTDQPTKSLPPQGRLGSYHRACELASRLVLHSTSSGHRGDDLGNVAADFHLTDRLSGDGQQVVTEADGFPTGFLRPSPTSPNHGRSQPGWKATVSIDQQYRNGDERGFRGQIDQENEAHRGKRGRSKQREFRDEEDFPLGNGRGACGALPLKTTTKKGRTFRQPGTLTLLAAVWLAYDLFVLFYVRIPPLCACLEFTRENICVEELACA